MWYEEKGKDGDIAVSSRIRLARNLEKYPFPGHMDEEAKKQVLGIVSEALLKSAEEAEFRLIELSGAGALLASSLAERHLISSELAAGEGTRGVILSRDEKVSVMINEEDHIRIQVLGSGICLEECYAQAERVDTLLEGGCIFAFDEKLGYLTHCPTNLGTGLRASVMLHLPAITNTGAVRNLIATAGKLGFAVRGLYGEGSAAKGDLYQISNQLTLGISEKEAIERLNDAVSNIIEQERLLRQRIKADNPGILEDKAWRATGVLAAARRLASDETMSLLSDLRLGVSMGEIEPVTIEDINRLTWEIQPAGLSLKYGEGMKPAERDMKRAELVRETARKAIQ